MLKRIMGLLLSACMLSATVAVTAEDTVKKSEAYDVLFRMSIIEKDSDELMTRAEFAQTIYNVKNFAIEKGADTTWSDNFFGEIADQFEIIEDKETNYKFTDVDPYDQYTEAILGLTTGGIMRGVAEDKFAPEQNVKNIEIIKTVLDFTGYTAMANIHGGYPSGYLAVAAELGISDGVSTSVKAEATVDDVARVIYNTFDVKLMAPGYGADGFEIKTSETDTLLTKIMQVDYVKGVMTDNGVTSLYGKSDVGEDEIICGGVTLGNSGVNATEIREFLGYNVKAYYYVADDLENEIVIAMPLDKNTVLTINAEDFNSYKDNRINYYNGTRDKLAVLSGDVKMIYNGVAKTSFSEKDFKISNGNITLIAPNGGNYETVIINSYISMYVSFIDAKEHIIYNKAYSSDGTNPQSLNLDNAVEDGTLGIYDAEGNKLEFADIAEGTVIDVRQSGDIIQIIVNKSSAEVAVKQIGTDDWGRDIVSDGENEYILDNTYLNSQNAESYSIGDTVKVYLNSFGKAAWIEKASAYTMKVGYLLKIILDEESGDEETVYLKVIDSEGKSVRYQLAEKVKFGDGETVDQSDYLKLKPSDVYKRLQGQKCILGYNLTKDKLIDIIELPLNKREGENRLQLVYNSNGEKVIYKPDGFGYFKDYTWTNDSTRVFTLPTDEALANDDTKYSCVARTAVFSTQGTYPVISYGTTSKANLAEYMVLQKDVVKQNDFSDSKQIFFIVSDVYEGLSPEDEPATILEGFKTSEYKSGSKVTEMTLYAKEGAGEDRKGNSVNPAKFATDTLSMNVAANPNPTYYQIKPGDIIRYTYDSEEIYPTGIELFFRADMENPYFKDGVRGAIPGSIGIVDNTLSPDYRYNPYVFTGSDGTLSGSVTDFNSSRRVMYGFVYSLDNDISTVTTQDLTVENYDPNLGGGKYVQSYVPMRGSSTRVTIDIDGKNISAKVAALTDIKPYNKYFSECSRILSVSSNGYFITIFVINGEWGK